MTDSPARNAEAAVEPDLRDRAQFGYWSEVTLRFSDLDVNGHVNNVAIGVLFQEGRTSFIRDVRDAVDDPAMAFAVARLTIDFVNEMGIPGSVEIGTRILAIGQSSLTLGQGLFRDGACVATSRAVMVRVNRGTPGSRPISEAERHHLQVVAATAQSQIG